MPGRLSPPPPPPFSRATRDARFAALAEEPFDLIVVGGGITGCGVARDAAMRGLRVVLLEKGDLASGTSSASSKLVHGGLRYLEHRAFGLVYESLSERHRLRRLAPHLVRPLEFVFPVYERRPRPLWQVSTALWIYDALSLFRSFELHRTHRGAEAATRLEPCLRTEGLDGAVSYYDCMTDDARLTLDTARSAHAAGAHVITYARVVAFTSRRGQITGVEVVDERSGAAKTVEGRVVLSATGPWTDRTRGMRGDRGRLLRPTKGVHLVVPEARLPLRSAVVMNAGRRTLFALPWGNRVVLGTTDTDFEGDFDDVAADASDVSGLLDLANHGFPDARLGPDDVIGTWAGLRPLVAEDTTATEDVSREHLLHTDDDGLITIAGGKLTTYRSMAAEVVDAIAGRLRAEGVHVGGCPTGAVKLPGGHGIEAVGSALRTSGPEGPPIDAEAADRLGPSVVRHLMEAHGGRWLDVAARTVDDRSAGERIVEDLPYLWAEIDVAVEEELAMTLVDVMRRRTQLQLRDVGQGMGVADAVARRMAALLDWDELRIHDELKAYTRAVDASFRWRAPRSPRGA